MTEVSVKSFASIQDLVTGRRQQVLGTLTSFDIDLLGNLGLCLLNILIVIQTYLKSLSVFNFSQTAASVMRSAFRVSIRVLESDLQGKLVETSPCDV